VLHHAAEGEITGAWMAAELGRHGYRISPGTLYPALHQLEDQGLLRSRETVEEGRMVRCYVATSAGRAALEDLRVALRELAREVLE
jgi:DNA-binding PadR family transcriptional regulator